MTKIIIFILLFISNNVFAYNNLDLEEYTRKLDKIDRIEKDLNILQKQFYRGNKNSKQTTKDHIEDSNLNLNLEIRIGSIEEQIRKLIGEIEKIEHQVNIQESQLKRFSEDIEFRLNEISSEQNKNSFENNIQNNKEKHNTESLSTESEKSNILGTVKTKDSEKIKEELQKKKDNVQIDFDNAFSLIKANKFNEAEVSFNKIIDLNKDNDITARSIYWIGEIYVARKDFEKAAINFLQSYKKSPKHPKASEALLKLITTLRNLKKNKEACAVIDKLNKEFPNLNDKILVKSQEESLKLNCKNN